MFFKLQMTLLLYERHFLSILYFILINMISKYLSFVRRYLICSVFVAFSDCLLIQFEVLNAD